MSEMTKIVLTSAFTIIGAIIIFVLGQLISKFFLEPIHELKQVLGKLNYSLIYYAREIVTPVPGDEEACKIAADEFRKLSSSITSIVESIPLYNFWSKVSFGFIPARNLVDEAASQLIGLSNSVFGNDRSANSSRLDKIKRVFSGKQ